MVQHDITDEDYALALAAGRRTAESEFRAEAVSYDPDRDAIAVVTIKNGGFMVPRRLVGALQEASPADLARMEIWPDGSVIEIEHLDIHLSVHGMIAAAFPVLVPQRIMAGLVAVQEAVGVGDAAA